MRDFKAAVRVVCALLSLSAAAPAAQVTITLLATTDLHGNIYPLDYFTGQPSERGLAKIASLVRAERRENPNTLLIDCGDTIEGSPLESVWQHYVGSGRLPMGLTFSGPPLEHDPMMLVMNALDYRAMVVGNHEFNFGLKNIAQARADARFPWLSANTVAEPGAAVRPFRPYITETIAGVKVAVIGVTTPSVPMWEEPAHYRGYRFIDGKAAVEAALAELRLSFRPDVVVVGVHAGLSRRSGEDARENIVREIAGLPGVDAIVFGHSHQQLAGERIGGVLLMQPKNWGISLGRMDFLLEGEPGKWKLSDKRSRLLPVTAQTPLDAEIAALARPYQDLTERHLNTPVAESPVEMEGRGGRIADTPLVDAIQTVQLYYAKADVSFTALFNTRVTVRKGPLTVREIAALYLYDNDLYAIEGTGRMVKEALENAARYFQSCPDAACSHGPLINRRFIGFNYDMAEGVDYDIDLSKPEGQRIVNLRRNGRPLEPDEKLRIAVNNYRAGGSGGYSMFRGAKVLWRSAQDIRSLIIAYYSEHPLPDRADGNWHILPPEAGKVLEREVLQESRPSDQ